MKSDSCIEITVTPVDNKMTWSELKRQVYDVKDYMVLADYDTEEFCIGTCIGDGVQITLFLGLYGDWSDFTDYIPYVSKLFPDLVFDCGGGYIYQNGQIYD